MGGNLFGIGLGELIFLAILILVIFGPRRLPEIAQTVGRFMREIHEATSGVDREFRQWMAEMEAPETWLGDSPQARQQSTPDAGAPPFPTPQRSEPSETAEEVEPSPPSLPG